MSDPSESAVPGSAAFGYRESRCAAARAGRRGALPSSHASSMEPFPSSVVAGVGLLIVTVIAGLVMASPLTSVATLCNASSPLGNDLVFHVPIHPYSVGVPVEITSSLRAPPVISKVTVATPAGLDADASRTKEPDSVAPVEGYGAAVLGSRAPPRWPPLLRAPG